MMEELIEVRELMQALLRDNVSPEHLVGCAIRNLYSLDCQFVQEGKFIHANNIRATLAYVKLLYDFGQQRNLSRTYLLHRIKLLEVREHDLNSEISILRGISPLTGDMSFRSVLYDGMAGKRGVEDEDSKSDPELEIILDTRIIGEIDQTSAALQNISQRLADKRNALRDIEQRMDDVSGPVLSSTVQRGSSFLEEELTDTCSSHRAERTLECESSNRPRDGSARISLPNHDNMDMQKEHDKVLPPQGALGSPRGRHGGAPDAAGSTVFGQASCEGTAGVVSVSAPVDQMATAEIDPRESVDCVIADSPAATHIDYPPAQVAGEKRKASTSPGSEVDGAVGIIARRPIKARAIEPTESPEARSISDNSEIEYDKDKYADNISENETGTITNEEIGASSSEGRITRASAKKKKKMADFSQLTESRKKKCVRPRSSRSSSTRREEYIESVVTRIRNDSDSSGRNVVSTDDESWRSSVSYPSRRDRNRKAEKNRRGSSERSTDNGERSSYHSSSKEVNKKKANKSGATDRTLKNPISKSRRRTQIPIIVTKEEAEKELQFCREDWLRMDPAALGERCLAHLAELEQQRSRCSNISGRVAGRMKESKQIATEITKAMIEKLITVGDVFTLRNENFSLKEELSELKRRERAQSEEIQNLRKMMSNLEREVRSLKEGHGPFPPMKKPHLLHKDIPRKSTTPPKEKVEVIRRKGILYSPPVLQQASQVEMEVEPLLSNTHGCSTDKSYMNREVQWPNGSDTTSWNMQNEEINNKNNISNVKSNYPTIKSNYPSTKLKEMTAESDASSNKSRKRIRIIEDRQLVPPSYPSSVYPSPSGDEWERVEKRRKHVQATMANTTANNETTGSRQRSINTRNKLAKSGKKLMKPAVVTITSKPGGPTYAQILAKARERISLKDLGIQTTVIRRSLNGAIIIEVPGSQGKQLAGSLKTSLAEVLGEEAKVYNPVAMGELRLRGIDPSTTTEEILVELMSLSGCPREEFKVSSVTNMRDGMGAAWISCPLHVAVRIAEVGTVTLGWTRVRIELLRKRPVQCYKCWYFGHVRSNCRSEIDRTGACFRCGLTGHIVGSCNAGMPRCLICEETGKEYRHRLGSPRCLTNHGFPSGVQPVRKASVDKLRKTSQSSDYDRRN